MAGIWALLIAQNINANLPTIISFGTTLGLTQSIDTNQTFYLTPTILKSYVPTQDKTSLYSAHITLAKEKSLTATYLTQLGIDYQISSNAKPSGKILDDANPNFDNYAYNYQISHQAFSLKGRLIHNGSFDTATWAAASFGVAVNTAHRFNNTPLLAEGVANNNFASNTSSGITYTLATGIQKSINQSWQFAIGYEFSDWGKSSLNAADGQTLNQGLNLSHLYTHNVLAELSYRT